MNRITYRLIIFRVFHAEQMFSRTQTYHRKCFNCGICKVSKLFRENSFMTILYFFVHYLYFIRGHWTVFWHAMVQTRMCIAGKQKCKVWYLKFQKHCVSQLLLFFRGCYGKKFGAKGYGFAGGSGFLQTGDL